MNEDLFALNNFNGTARLFPLPNVVLFPNVIQPLHIFEPRYRQMTADALTGDRLIGLVLLRPGWETDYEGRPPLYPVACLGRIVADQRLDDGRYNILLRGLTRARIVSEVMDDKPYRSARIQLVGDSGNPAPSGMRELRKQIRHKVIPWFPSQGPALDQLHKLLQSDLPLGVLCDILGFALPLAPEIEQGLLEQFDVLERARGLLHQLETGNPSPNAVALERKFPPDFSPN
jgi:Lon protease-like protein